MQHMCLSDGSVNCSSMTIPPPSPMKCSATAGSQLVLVCVARWKTLILSSRCVLGMPASERRATRSQRETLWLTDTRANLSRTLCGLSSRRRSDGASLRAKEETRTTTTTASAHVLFLLEKLVRHCSTSEVLTFHFSKLPSRSAAHNNVTSSSLGVCPHLWQSASTVCTRTASEAAVMQNETA